jgi:hypothetical protein
MTIMEKEMISIPINEYRHMVAGITRLWCAVEYLEHCEFPDNNDVIRILTGREDRREKGE